MGLQIVLLVTMLTCILTANGLTCYECDSTSDSNCADPFVSTGITTTNCTTNNCYKSEADDSVTRSCGGTDTTDFTTTCIDFLGVEICGSACEEDLCNGSTAVAVSGVLLLVTCALANIID